MKKNIGIVHFAIKSWNLLHMYEMTYGTKLDMEKLDMEAPKIWPLVTSRG